eukprot:CAMPEP_0201276104 /NCGR_PEP_ID=MMETSP0853-20130426/55026_1 /ASSEMBLY_ACC=CAM_ASM_000640 /TAXON_ID=183588 /ORGANISM="Pseudo-nitzschia fraudulenta, Strain WWA7" /LENGTH=120 /DNA_ID=CAMNT_0047583933 /DNA_START=171 /DNA_END=534 /DNA_ORIENTATION=+
MTQSLLVPQQLYYYSKVTYLDDCALIVRPTSTSLTRSITAALAFLTISLSSPNNKHCPSWVKSSDTLKRSSICRITTPPGPSRSFFLAGSNVTTEHLGAEDFKSDRGNKLAIEALEDISL